MNKYSAIGSLIGIIVGIVVCVVFPTLLNIELVFNKSQRTLQGFTEDQYLFKSGSVYAVGIVLPTLLGLVGGTVGYFWSKRSS